LGVSALVERVREFLKRPQASANQLVEEVFSSYLAHDGNVPDEEWHELVQMIGAEALRAAAERAGGEGESFQECAEICEAIVSEARSRRGTGDM